MIKIASPELSAEWLKLIESLQVPDRVDGELNVNEFAELSGIKRTSAERILRLEVKEGRMIRHLAKIDGRSQYVYQIINK